MLRARAGAEIEVPSPSYTLVQDYRFADLVIRHIDLYRIEDPAELLELGLDAPAAGEAWLIEWPERAAAVLPPDRLDLELRQGDAAGCPKRPSERRARLGAASGRAAQRVRSGRVPRAAARPEVRGRSDVLA